MRLLIWTYRELIEKFPTDSKALYEWWLAYPKKKERNMNRDQEFTKSAINSFYSNSAKIQRLEANYKVVNKFLPKEADDLIKHWQQIKVYLCRFDV